MIVHLDATVELRVGGEVVGEYEHAKVEVFDSPAVKKSPAARWMAVTVQIEDGELHTLHRVMERG
jgi:hypothetical protein